MDDQQPTPIPSSGRSSLPTLPETLTEPDTHIIDNLEQRSAVDGPNHLSAPSDLQSRFIRIVHTCSRRIQWTLWMARMGLENIAFAHPALTVLSYAVNALPLGSRHVTSENRGRAAVSLYAPLEDGERSDRVPSVQARHQMHITTDRNLHPLPLIATLLEQRSENVPLGQASQHSVQIPPEQQRVENLPDDEPLERITSIQVSFLFSSCFFLRK
ncbi:hypothetical protein FIBSPDRAFT_318534 [Athelia psychrophila]|uniref:Uncharacterized protein n=1 Tax=Athelia psychrophila TaxID=1759441 RepID=A0A167WTZ4_9AGAM|nr:hypothetical protein FIBSPDRAFT_318534 [Fibularhizoctonia sp. CBS 109695]